MPTPEDLKLTQLTNIQLTILLIQKKRERESILLSEEELFEEHARTCLQFTQDVELLQLLVTNEENLEEARAQIRNREEQLMLAGYLGYHLHRQ